MQAGVWGFHCLSSASTPGLIIGVSKTNDPHACPSNSSHCHTPSPKVQEGTLGQLLSDLGVELISKHPVYLETKSSANNSAAGLEFWMLLPMFEDLQIILHWAQIQLSGLVVPPSYYCLVMNLDSNPN